ncbi:MAG: MBL fold metallo-hydrolase [Oscillospiraceae bacterium]|jgi:beta-lactamase superfamily II metal-dependent hydrolase|nr:MBL fold metallo-hydrolase [Oscillospiraceae bacterium]
MGYRKRGHFFLRVVCFALVVLGVLGALFIDIDDYARLEFRIKDLSFSEILDFFKIKTSYSPKTEEGLLTIWEIDVGQGKSILAKNEEHAVLVDAGDVEYGSRVVNFLRQKDIERLNYLIITHPHADHIGGARKILEALPVDVVMLPKMSKVIIPTTNIFSNFLDTVKEKKIRIVNPVKGESFALGKADFEILSDFDEAFDLNNLSIVTKIRYKNFAFLSTGDIEELAEEEMLKSEGTAAKIKCNVLDVAHHGSKTSTGLKFLDAANPEVALISVGINDYGHPSAKVLGRFREKGILYFCTSKEGTIQVNVFDDHYSVLNSKGEEIKREKLG